VKKIILIVIIAFVVGCTEENPLEPISAPTLPIVAFKGPNTTSTHEEAKNVKAFVSSFNAFTTSFDAFSLTQPTVSGDTYTWTLTESSLTLRLTATIRSDSGYTWKLILNGNDGSTTYNNWTAIEGTTDAGMRNAAWNIYEDNTTTKSSDFLWTITSSGSLVGTLNQYVAGALSGQTTITDNANFTGEVRVYQSTVQTYRAIWLSNGSGQYFYYDANGVVTSQGTWQ